MKPSTLVLFLVSWFAISNHVGAAESKTPVLILNGRNNHDWKTTTAYLKATLESTGRFDVHVSTAPADKAGPPPKRPKAEDAAYLDEKSKYDALVKSLKPALDAAWAKWSVDFSKFKAVVLDYNGPEWPKPMQQAFAAYVRGGGGVMLIHGANNAFSNWTEFNDMIGLGWRKGGFGKCLIVNQDGSVGECCAGDSSGHGSKHPFVVTNRATDHPILRGMPVEWMHAKDELYHHMRGPAKNVTILASAFSEEKQRGSGRHEPVLYETLFGSGRVLVCTMGHRWPGDVESESLECVGFQAVVARGVEYLGTGKVTLPLPAAMPTKETQSLLKPQSLSWNGGPAISTKFVEISSGPNELSFDWLLGKDKPQGGKFMPLSIEDEKKTFVLQPGFTAECIASEPMVEEPVLTVWDGDGAMYVAEMRGYMQDEAGTGTKSLKNGRIKRLVDTDDDGVMDKATVFVDGLNLPRMVLPLDDRIAVVETDSTSVWSYRDTDEDGVADEKVLLFKGKEGDSTRSVEHQDSGLDWNIDNWINISYACERYRFTDCTWRAEPLKGLWSQWGVTHDEVGRVFYSANSDPALGQQMPRQYWSLITKRGSPNPRPDEPISLGLAWDMNFLSAKNLCATDDRGGPAPERKIFTSLCGQSFHRGDYFVCDPTIHVVRRAKVENRNGRIFLSNAHGEDEFMLASDIFFRPVNTATSPDGSLIVTDMYRGIIQDAPWLSPGPREFIKASGLAAVTHHGRIWRIRDDQKPGAKPRMLSQPTSELVAHLAHDIQWWRDTAQRLIILRKDRESIVPQLAKMARDDTSALARLHALWTLDGMDKTDAELVRAKMSDSDARLRVAAMRISEKNIDAMLDAIAAVAKDERDPEVARQIILSLGYCMDDKIIPVCDALTERFLTHEGVFLAACTVFWKKPTPFLTRIQSGEPLQAIKDPAERAVVAARWTQGMAQWDRGLVLPKDMPMDQQKLLTGGEAMYYQTCVSCHGPDGKGVTLPGTEMHIAPALAGSARVKGPAAGMVPVLLNGLLGPIEGKTYPGMFMAPAAALGITRDDRLAEVISFIRYAWGNEAGSVTADEVKAFRKQHERRAAPWTDDELKKITAPQ